MANGASAASEVSPLAAGGPGARSRAPGGVQGQRPGGGRGGEAPRSQRVSTHLIWQETPFLRHIHVKNPVFNIHFWLKIHNKYHENTL